jgi:hypothetical protein
MNRYRVPAETMCTPSVCQRRVVEVVPAHNGSINEFMGDGVRGC